MSKSTCTIDDYGNREWRDLDGKLHREDGPAIEYEDRKVWYLYGKCHRIDGSAVERNTGFNEWWYKGKYIDCNSQKEFERLLRLKAFW